MKKKLLSLLLISASLFSLSVPSVLAATESWRDAFVTRLMKVISSDPTYSEVVLTDLDKNGVPEAFVIKDSNDGGIGAAFTLNGSSIQNIEVPGDIIGSCLKDITVYIKNGNYIFVGREIPRYTSAIRFYKLVFDGTKLECVKINKEDVSPYPTVPYVDMYGNNFLTSGYPNRAKIKEFVDSYDSVNQLTAEKTISQIIVNGKTIEVPGYNVNDYNYFKIRDIAMILRSTSAKFNVGWDRNLNGITISTGEKYVIEGGELSEDDSIVLDISETEAPIYVDGEEIDVKAYSINGSTYFKIRDVADMVGFDVEWNQDEQAIVIQTN